jgi:hypothetical protein
MGSSGLSAGAFLVSPYSTDGAPDIQLTVFPTVFNGLLHFLINYITCISIKSFYLILGD